VTGGYSGRAVQMEFFRSILLMAISKRKKEEEKRGKAEQESVFLCIPGETSSMLWEVETDWLRLSNASQLYLNNRRVTADYL